MTAPFFKKRIARPFVVSLLLAALTMAALGVILGNGFISLDDQDYITRNTLVRNGLSVAGVRWAFTTFHAGNWHPLTWLSHMLDVQLFGLRPGAHHAVGLIFHTANALLLFYLLRALTGALWRSALVAALFAVHPLHVESVAWAAERKDLLSTFFMLCTALAYVRAVRRNAMARSVTVPLLFALALLSKAMVLTLPGLLLLLDWWPLGRWARTRLPPAGLWREKAPLFLLAVAVTATTFIAQKSSGTIATSVSAAARLANAAVSYVRYLGKTLWPRDLTPFYPYPEQGLPLVTVVAAILLLGLLTAGALRLAAGRPCLALGWFWYLGTLLPVIGLVQVGGQAMADRYTYFPLTGIFVALTWGLAEIVRRHRPLAVTAAGLSLALLLALAMVSKTQATLWREPRALFTQALRIDANNWLAMNVLGNRLLVEGRAEEAMSYFRRAIAVHASFFDGNHNLGIALAALGRPQEALPHFREALRIRPRDPFANHNFGRALLQLGRAEEALGFLRTAVALNPYDAAPRADLGAALGALGKSAEAGESLEAALRLDPGKPLARYNLGLFLLSQGRTAEALPHFKQLAQMNLGDAQLYRANGVALAAHGQRAEAITHYEKSLEIEPESFDSHLKLGAALFESGRFEEGVEHLRRAVGINPADAAALNDLGAALAQTGRLEEAVSMLRRALALDGGAIDAHLNLGLALLDRGELEQAAYELLEASSLDPSDTRVAPALEKLLSKPRGEVSLAKASRRKPRPPGLPTEPGRHRGSD